MPSRATLKISCRFKEWSVQKNKKSLMGHLLSVEVNCGKPEFNQINRGQLASTSLNWVSAGSIGVIWLNQFTSNPPTWVNWVNKCQPGSTKVSRGQQGSSRVIKSMLYLVFKDLFTMCNISNLINFSSNTKAERSCKIKSVVINIWHLEW